VSNFASRFEARGERVRLTAAAPDVLAIIRIADDITVGSIILSEEPNGLRIERLCIEQEHRSYGAGSEAAYLLVTGARNNGIPRLRAWAHPNLGLSVYFWTRMGFSPRHGEGPEGGIWFERVVEPMP
jgi:hypothetical protein